MKYGKTKQFRNIVRDITHDARFQGLDEQGEPIYSHAKLPELEFTGTVKLHGTNAGLHLSADSKQLKYLSRNREVKQGHYGFVEAMRENGLDIRVMFGFIRNAFPEGSITVYGEWAGPGIQSGVAISDIEKPIFFVFAVRNDVDGNTNWLDLKRHLTYIGMERIRSIYEYPTYKIKIDFEKPQLSQNKLVEYTERVEKECPVSKFFGIDGLGEGIVWETFYKGRMYKFKTKGKKHSASKVKTLAEVDPERLQSIFDFVDYAVTDNRVEQAVKEVKQNLEIDFIEQKHTGDILRWVANDIIDEESDVLEKSNLVWKDVAKECSRRARDKFFKIIEI